MMAHYDTGGLGVNVPSLQQELEKLKVENTSLQRDRARLRNMGHLMSIHQIIAYESPKDNKWYWRRMGHYKNGPYDNLGEAIDAAMEDDDENNA